MLTTARGVQAVSPCPLGSAKMAAATRPRRTPQAVDTDRSFTSWRVQTADKAMAYAPGVTGAAVSALGVYIAIDKPWGLTLTLAGGVLGGLSTWWSRNVAPRIKKRGQGQNAR